MSREDFHIGSEFNISKVPLDNVSSEFKKNFIDYYNDSINLMNSNDILKKANGVGRLGVLKKMSLRMDEYDINSDFESSYYSILKESESFTET